MNALRRRILKLATLLGALTGAVRLQRPLHPGAAPGRDLHLPADGRRRRRAEDGLDHPGLPSQQAAFARYFVFNESPAVNAGIIATAGADGTFTGEPLDGAEVIGSGSTTRRRAATTASRSVSC